MNNLGQIAMFVALLLAAFPVSGQGPITVLKDFGDDSLLGGVVQVQDGTFFGVSGNVWAGPPPAPSTVFHMAASGAILTSYTFPADGSQGLNPNPLVQASDGNLYGTTMLAGDPTAKAGTAFRVTAAGVQILHIFKSPDGIGPFGRLVEGNDGNLYGTTLGGGTSGDGTVFRMDKTGSLQTIFSFSGTNGKNPIGDLVAGPSGNFFGATVLGGSKGFGTVFKITPAGALTTIYSFQGAHACPNALARSADGSLYGTTADLSIVSPVSCSAANINTAFGSIFRISPLGVFSVLHSFAGNGVSPAFPSGAPLLASDGNLYGVSNIGGSGFLAQGTIFQFTPSGQLSWSSFLGGSNGASPCCELLQSTDGSLIGVTQGFLDIEFGNEDAVVFSTGHGLPQPAPSILTVLPNSGKVGSVVKIRGDHFLLSSQMTFNGVVAKFTIASTNFIWAIVPPGAATGPIAVTNPGGTGASPVAFTVLP